MTLADAEVRPADGLSPAALTALWNQAYEAYFVNIEFTPEMMARHLRRAGIDLALSRVLWRDGVAAGVSLVARRGARGYLGGFGIVLAQRRRGLAARLLSAQLDALRAAGLREVLLEVIEQNPAREVYARGGFELQRRLLVLDGLPDSLPAAPSVALDDEALSAAHARANDRRPTWRRDLPTLRDAIAHDGARAFGVLRDGQPCAYAVTVAAGDRLTLLDAGALDDAAALALLGALRHRHPGLRQWRLGDEPEGTPLARVTQARGMVVAIAQVEMRIVL